MSKIIAVDVNEVHDFSLPEDTSDPKVIFKIGTLDSYAMAYIMEITKKTDQSKFLSLIDIVRIGLKGWENLKNRAGVLVPFEIVKENIGTIGDRELVSKNSIMALHTTWITKIADKIIELNYLTEDDKKK